MGNNMPNSAMAVLTLFPETTLQINSFADQVVNKIIAGEVDALQVDYFLKTFEIVSEKIRKHFEVKDILFDAIEKNNNQPFKGAESITVQSKTTYDYSHNPAWVALDEQKKQLEKLMKSIDEPIVIEGTGEEILPAKIKSISKFVKYNFAK
jgi:hypothetical protein